MYIQSTRDTQSNVYQDAVAIRFKVFVQGQGVPSAIEIDQNESHCIYFVLYNEAHQAIATVRLLPDSESNQVTLQRMAVFDDYQGKGIGSLLLQEAEKVAQEQSFHSISLHAQLGALDFYLKNAYKAVGHVFEEAGIQHITAEKFFSKDKKRLGQKS